jgi:CheY-like chemotaxis protein
MQLSEARVLVVDDECALREIFAKWLVSGGCGEVVTAADGAEALETLQASQFDMLISDVRMPRMDGITLVRRLAELGKSIPSIIFVSGFGDVDEREMYGQGVEAFLAKPLRMEELVGAIKRALAERSSLWLTPMEVSPRQKLEVDVNGCTASDSDKERDLRLGRGGFSVKYPHPLSLGKVAFECRCTETPGSVLSGQGLVRWRSRTDQRVGIEFAYIEGESRGKALALIAEEKPRCFIPR